LIDAEERMRLPCLHAMGDWEWDDHQTSPDVSAPVSRLPIFIFFARAVCLSVCSRFWWSFFPFFFPEESSDDLAQYWGPV
jgi:hypothetical protein